MESLHKELWNEVTNVGNGGVYLSEGMYLMPDGELTADPWTY